MHGLREIAAAALLSLTLLAAPTGAAAEPGALPAQPVSLTFDARITSSAQRQVPGEYNGKLRLRIERSGTILGTYQPNSGPGFDSVNGGLESNGSIWLEMGSYGQVQIHGTYANGRIDGVASGPGITRLTFVATPAKS
jgi:hypothetical protein